MYPTSSVLKTLKGGSNYNTKDEKFRKSVYKDYEDKYRTRDYGAEATKRVASDPLIQARANRTYADVYRAGVQGGTDYMARTGQGQGTAGGGARSALLRVLGGARGVAARDNMLSDEEKFQAGALESSDRTALDASKTLFEMESSRRQDDLARDQLKLQEKLALLPYKMQLESEINTATDLDRIGSGYASPIGQPSSRYGTASGTRRNTYSRLFGGSGPRYSAGMRRY